MTARCTPLFVLVLLLAVAFVGTAGSVARAEEETKADDTLLVLCEVWRVDDAALVGRIEELVERESGAAASVRAMLAAGADRADRLVRLLMPAVHGRRVAVEDTRRIPMTVGSSGPGDAKTGSPARFVQVGARLQLELRLEGNGCVRMELKLRVLGVDEHASGSHLPRVQSSTDLEATILAPLGAMRMFQSSTQGAATHLVFVRGSRMVEDEPSGVPRPKVTWIRGGDRVRIEFDDGTFEMLRRIDPEGAQASVATEPYRDPATGEPAGIRVTGVGPGSPASLLEVQPGDILSSIDGQPVHTRADAIRILRGLAPDTAKVRIVIDRKGREIVLEIDPRDPKARRAPRTPRVPESDDGRSVEEPDAR